MSETKYDLTINDEGKEEKLYDLSEEKLRIIVGLRDIDEEDWQLYLEDGYYKEGQIKYLWSKN